MMQILICGKSGKYI